MSDTSVPARTRTVTWEDPLPGAEAGRGMSGLQFCAPSWPASCPIRHSLR
jgi:hypothetical protein